MNRTDDAAKGKRIKFHTWEGKEEKSRHFQLEPFKIVIRVKIPIMEYYAKDVNNILL